MHNFIHHLFDSDIERVILVLLLLLSGMILGALIIYYRVALNLSKVYISPLMRGTKTNFVKIKDEESGEEVVYVNPETVKQSLAMFYDFARWKIGGRKEHAVYQDKKKEKNVFRCFVCIIVLVSVFVLATLLAVIAV